MYDTDHGKVSAKVMPGHYYVTIHDEVISTVLGSCVAACIRDPDTGIGGMNHFMLPGSGASAQTGGAGERSLKYGSNAMNALIDTVVQWGGKRDNLELKLFGGGAVLDFDHNRIGEQNIRCARACAQEHNLEIVAEDMGGEWPRKVVYDPITGRAMVRRMRRLQAATIVADERRYMQGTVE
ncbi:MAG: chemoreceptor glutamine deamidase CheD [Pseudomonadota bacterium]